MKKTVLTIGVLAFIALGLTSCGGEKSHDASKTPTESHEGHNHDAHEGHDHGDHGHSHDEHGGHSHDNHEGHNH